MAVFFTAFGLIAQGQETPANQIRGLLPRPGPTDYQSHAPAGALTIAAEFMGHSVPTADGNLSTEDYVVVETGVYGMPDAHATLSLENFSLRINGKKNALSPQPYGAIFTSLNDPDWVPPEAPPSAIKGKTSITGGGGGGAGEPNAPPPKPKIPVELRRTMQQRVQKAALPEGDRALPIAGLLFFQYTGKTQGIHSIELIYNGSAGKATLALH